jgi:hypothetical protein
MSAWSPIRRATWERLAVLALITGFVVLTAAPAATRGTICSEDTPASSVSTASRDAEQPTSRGIDLELRIFNLRIEFPWMKALPITPGHHIVITVLSAQREPAR